MGMLIEPKPIRKRRRSHYESESSGTTGSDVDDAEPRSKKVRAEKTKHNDKPHKATQSKVGKKGEATMDSESDMSVLIDEPPKKKRASKPGKSSSKPAKASKQPLDPDEEHIKTLKNQLKECGIRKMWGNELKHCETDREKITHLKQMLTDVGLKGRYSAEKAMQIREQRELAEDLQVVQEGNKTWGKSKGDSEDSTGARKPQRRIAKGLRELDFLNDDDGEETSD